MTRARYVRDTAAVDEALDAMGAEELRDLIRDLIPQLDDTTQGRLLLSIVDRAARGASGWAPGSPDPRRLEEIEAFSQAARRVGHANPHVVDDYLRQGTQAFLARDYPAAFRIFRALLIPINDTHLHLGQNELVDEVLGVDLQACTRQYAVAMYMTAAPKDRAAAVLSAIQSVEHIGFFSRPLHDLEQILIEPLPDFNDFLVGWRSLVEARRRRAAESIQDRLEDQWLREVVARTQGPSGLAELARASRRVDDLRAWCQAWVDAGDWQAAHRAFIEATELAADQERVGAELLDGAALAAQELGSDDLDALLERAWRRAATFTRLCRWLGGSTSKDVFVQRMAAALDGAPKNAKRQRALLHVLRGEHEQAAQHLIDAPGDDWESTEHPGHLVFLLFMHLLCAGGVLLELPRSYDDPGIPMQGDDRPRLHTPDLAALLTLAGLQTPEDASVRAALSAALREAAEKRLARVTATRQRRQYEHAMSLITQCVAVDPSEAAEAWREQLLHVYWGYPALKR